MLFHLLFAPHLLPLLQESGPQTRVWLAGRTENQGQCSLSLFLKQPVPRLPRCWACHKWQRHAGQWRGSGCYFGQQLAAKQPSCKVKPHLAANRRQEAIGRALLTRTASCCAVSPLIRKWGQAPLLCVWGSSDPEGCAQSSASGLRGRSCPSARPCSNPSCFVSVLLQVWAYRAKKRGRISSPSLPGPL